jgi:hypothetical protein
MYVVTVPILSLRLIVLLQLIAIPYTSHLRIPLHSRYHRKRSESTVKSGIYFYSSVFLPCSLVSVVHTSRAQP